MGSNIPLVALLAKPPEQEPGPLDMAQQAQQLSNLRNLGQGERLENQQRQQSLKDQQAQTAALQQWDHKNPDDLPGLIVQNGGSASASMAMQQTLLGIRQKASDIAKNDSETGKNNLQTLQDLHDQYRGRLMAIVNGPDAQKQQNWDSEITKEEQAGQIQPGTVSHTYPGDDQAKEWASHYALGSVLAKEAIDAQMSGARQKQADTSASEAPSLIARNTAEATKANAETGMLGQVTPKDVYAQQQENYRATLARQATNANQRQNQGIAALQKQGDTYSQFLSTANSVKQSLAAAQSGNEMAAAVAPLQGTLFVTTSEGVKRINNTELQGIEGAGSLVQRISGALGKQTGKGPLSDDLKNDMGKLVDLYTTAKYGAYRNQARYTQQLHGLDPTGTPILAQDGSISGGPSASGTIRIKASDGRLHDIPSGNLAAAKKIDPNLQVVQ